MASSDSWTTIESDPGVFTELISSMGATGLEVAELWSVERDALAELEPIYGFIFLFKWQKESEERPSDPDFHSRGIFFANQVINNACATQAIISILMNIPSGLAPGFSLGPELTALKEFTADFPPDVRGLAIGNSDAIRTIHNSFHAPQSLIHDEKNDADKDADAFHFVAYIPAAGGLYELDGLKEGPLRLCECTVDDWLARASEAVTARIAKYSETEQRFNLMAVVRNRLEMCEEQLSRAQRELEHLRKNEEESSGSASADEEAITRKKIASAEAAGRELSSAVAAEQRKRQRWRDENIRRRTDYTPFAFNLLKALAAEGQLQGLVATAEEQ